jgi:hypothetical protein
MGSIDSGRSTMLPVHRFALILRACQARDWRRPDRVVVSLTMSADRSSVSGPGTMARTLPFTRCLWESHPTATR